MTEDAKHTADKDAAQKSGQKQEQNEKPETVEEKELEVKPEDSAAETTIPANDGSKKDNSEESSSEDTPEVAEASEDTKTEKVISSETTVLSEDPKITLTVAETEDDNSENEAKTDGGDIEIEIGLKKKDDDEFQQSVREQIENCKFEIISSVQDSVHTELRGSIKELRRQDRRRRVGFILRDIIILLLAAALGYTIYCLYDAQYFDFMKPQCVRDNTCSVIEKEENKEEGPIAVEVIKDTNWYRNNYGYLFDALQLKLNADEVSAYYLYSGDYRANEIQPNYLLGMAYNVLNSNTTYDSTAGIVIPSADLKTAFANLFGTTDYFVKQNFTNGCVDFEYDRASDSFITPAVQCVSNANREIVEEINEIFEEGNVMYFITTAAIYDKSENALYNFDNLFKSVAQNVDKDNLEKYQASLNQYQYRFKKIDEKYYFSDIVKLK